MFSGTHLNSNCIQLRLFIRQGSFLEMVMASSSIFFVGDILGHTFDMNFDVDVDITDPLFIYFRDGLLSQRLLSQIIY